jgi:hypothetical protein
MVHKSLQTSPVPVYSLPYDGDDDVSTLAKAVAVKSHSNDVSTLNNPCTKSHLYGESILTPHPPHAKAYYWYEDNEECTLDDVNGESPPQVFDDETKTSVGDEETVWIDDATGLPVNKYSGYWTNTEDLFIQEVIFHITTPTSSERPSSKMVLVTQSYLATDSILPVTTGLKVQN